MRNELLDLIFAPVCLSCDARVATGDKARLICRRCRTRLIAIPTPACDRCGTPRLQTGRRDNDCHECRDWPACVRAARSACILAPPADRIVHQFKYRGWMSLSRPMAERLAQVELPNDTKAEAIIVIPVGTTAARLRARGYNQAELLARDFAAISGRVLVPALQRSVGGTQTTLQPVARGANVAGAFQVAPGLEVDLRDAHVIVVDDVLTTGATLIECARTLAEAGVRCVSALTFARALDARRLVDT